MTEQQQREQYNRNLVKDVYKKFLLKSDIAKRAVPRRIGSPSALSSVYKLNANIVGKVAMLSANNSIIKNTQWAWDILRNKIDDEVDPSSKKILQKLISIPLHTEGVKVPTTTGGTDIAVVSIEQFIKGKDLNWYIKNPKFMDEHFNTLTFIIFDILRYLGKYGFNHNDFHFGNVMVVKGEDIDMGDYTSLNKYDNGTTDENINIKSPQYVPIIIDFDWASFLKLHPSQQNPQSPPSQLQNAVNEQFPTGSDTACIAYFTEIIKNHSGDKEPLCVSLWHYVHCHYFLPNFRKMEWSPSIDTAFFLETLKCNNEEKYNNIMADLYLDPTTEENKYDITQINIPALVSHVINAMDANA